MSYSLSFAEDFFTGDGFDEGSLREAYPVTRRPQSVMQALVSEEKLCPRRFRKMINEVLGYNLTEPLDIPVDETVLFDLLEKVREYSTCDTLTPPIQVYLSKDHYVTVYEDIEEEVA